MNQKQYKNISTLNHTNRYETLSLALRNYTHKNICFTLPHPLKYTVINRIVFLRLVVMPNEENGQKIYLSLNKKSIIYAFCKHIASIFSLAAVRMDHSQDAPKRTNVVGRQTKLSILILLPLSSRKWPMNFYICLYKLFFEHTIQETAIKTRRPHTHTIFSDVQYLDRNNQKW